MLLYIIHIIIMDVSILENSARKMFITVNIFSFNGFTHKMSEGKRKECLCVCIPSLKKKKEVST